MTFSIRIDDLQGPEIAALIAAHADLMLDLSPPGSCHFLSLDGLRDPAITVWSLWPDGALGACGALKHLGNGAGEIKAMHTAKAERGKGLGAIMLEHILEEAGQQGLSALYLETGSMDGFLPARRLYERYGFAYCAPFGDYVEDPHSVFMTLGLS